MIYATLPLVGLLSRRQQRLDAIETVLPRCGQHVAERGNIIRYLRPSKTRTWPLRTAS